MSGLSLKVGGFGGVGQTAAPQFGTQQSYDTVTSAAFGPGVSVPVTSKKQALTTGGFGVAVSTGIAAICALVFIRHSLPR